MLTAVVPEFFQLVACASQRVVGGAVLQPGSGAADPLEQVAGHALVLLHKTLVLLVHLQHLTDTVGSCFSLNEREDTSSIRLSHRFASHRII